MNLIATALLKFLSTLKTALLFMNSKSHFDIFRGAYENQSIFETVTFEYYLSMNYVRFH